MSENPNPRDVLRKLADANPGVCECGHDSSRHGSSEHHEKCDVR